MGFHEVAVRAGWSRAMRMVERRIVAAGELGTELAPAARRAVQADARPVLLVPGYGNSSASMRAFERSLARDGFDVTTATLPEGNMGPAADAIAAIRAQVREVQARTGAARIDLVGHSRGGVLARAAAQLPGDADGIGRVVTVHSANQSFHLGAADRVLGPLLPDGMQEIRRGAPLVRALDDTLDDALRERMHAVGTGGFDGVLLPVESARIPGAAFSVVDEGRTIGPFSRVTHYGVLRDDVAYDAVRGALLAAS